MKRTSVVNIFLTYVLIISGCASLQDSEGSMKGSKGDLVLIEGETVCQEVLTHKFWQFSKEGPFSSLEEANRYAAELKLGGYDDWRLPTKSELFDLYYIHYWKNDGNCVMNHKGEFWTVSKNREPSLGHWEDDILCGPEFNYVESIKEEGSVRAIRP